MKRIDHVAIPEEPKVFPIVSPLDPRDMPLRELSSPLHDHSSLDTVLWVIPSAWRFRNDEQWQMTTTVDGKYKVYLVYERWSHKVATRLAS